MFKLLTEEAREKVGHEYVIRRIIVMISGLILVSLTAIIGLLPSYVLSHARKSEVLERTRIMNSVSSGEDESKLQAWLMETNARLSALSPKFDVDRPSDFIKKIIDQKVKGISLKGFSWSKAENHTNLLVTGVAVDRETLITFENHINSSGFFSEVTVPISNLAKDKDIDFQIKFSPL